MERNKPSYQIATELIKKAYTENVTELRLDNFGLSKLPPSIGKLKSLVSLSLAGNKLSLLPVEITQLNSLELLDLSKNGISKLPAEIPSLTKLEVLYLANNRINDLSAAFLKLTNLKIIDLSGNGLRFLPQEIYELPNLRALYLSSNRFETLSSDIAKLKNLTRVWLDDNELSLLPSEIGKLTRLKDFGLVGNNLKALPRKIGRLTELEVLSLAGNKLRALPSEIGMLTNLGELNLAGNEIHTLPPEIGNLISLTKLNLIANKLESIPLEIEHLKNLKSLQLSQNRISSLPSEIKHLSNLETLALGDSWLGGNELTVLPAWIGKLSGLRNLEISSNKIYSLPPEIGKLTNLVLLDVSGNELEALPSEIKKITNLKELNLKGNANLPIPPEILKRIDSPAVILNTYFGGQRPLYEAKAIFVGQGSVGKTSLVKRIIKKSFEQGEDKTEGIEISSWKVDSENDIQSKISLNIWDFGGQEVMHATHQFFLTKRSLYLLVLDSRLTQEENRVEYWLKIIQSFSDNSPVLIVGNKIDQHSLDIDRTGLQKKYSNIVGILETSAATGVGIEELKAAITEQVNGLPHVRDLLPESWFAVKTKLEGLRQEENFITQDKYLDLCAENEVSDESSQRTLIGFLHDLGVVLHFQDDPRLESLGILNPQWVTNGVYKILNSHELFKNKGVLERAMLNEILNAPEYPSNKRLFIVDMMRKFELCYDLVPDKKFLVPDLLPKDEPELSFNGIPAFEYAYPVLPSSVVTRFIVRMSQKIDDGFVWRTGVLLKIGNNHALVKADIEDKKISISIGGLEHTRRDALSAIRYQLDEIHESIKGLNPQKRVPIPNAPNAEAQDYEYLLMLEREGQDTLMVKDGVRLVKVNVRAVLSGIESEAKRRETGGNMTTINIMGNVNGSNIVSGDNNVITQRIQESFNKADKADIQAELKETLKQLAEAVATMNKELPEEKAEEAADDLEKLIEEATKDKPNKKWYSVSIEGLIQAAENLEKLGKPVIDLSQKVLSLLTGGVVN